MRLAVTLSNAHIELNGNPDKSKAILTDLDKEFNSESLHPYNKAKLNLSWAKVCRYMAVQVDYNARHLSIWLSEVYRLCGIPFFSR